VIFRRHLTVGLAFLNYAFSPTMLAKKQEVNAKVFVFIMEKMPASFHAARKAPVRSVPFNLLRRGHGRRRYQRAP
jgi:hypothetical protein